MGIKYSRYTKCQWVTFFIAVIILFTIVKYLFLTNLEVIIRPFPPDLNHVKVDSLIDTLKVCHLVFLVL